MKLHDDKKRFAESIEAANNFYQIDKGIFE